MTGEWKDVTSQAELDACLAAGNWPVCSGNGHFRAYDSATVRAYDSATVEAYGSATVRAYGSATVRAYDSATVRAYDSATVEASGSATVRAYGSATVEASGSATVRASGSATVRASRYVAVTRHGDSASVTGGVLIDIPPLDNLPAWLDFYDVEHTATTATLYKAVGADFKSGYGTLYQPGTTTEPDDWQATNECGHGLHFGPTPHHAATYYMGTAPRFLAVEVDLADTVVIHSGGMSDKVKARACRVLHEVARDGRPLAAVAA